MCREGSGVWDEALRQGEAVLDRQLEAKTEALRGTESLLRLSVATLGGIIALGGLVITLDSDGSVALLVGLGVASVPAAGAAFCHSIPLVGTPKRPGVVFGPDFDAVIDALERGGTTRDMLVESTVRSVPHWLAAINAANAEIQKWNARGLFLLALTVVILLGTWIYIQGGRIFG